jgi:hypothetical protein
MLSANSIVSVVMPKGAASPRYNKNDGRKNRYRSKPFQFSNVTNGRTVMTRQQCNGRDEKYNQTLSKFVMSVIGGFTISIVGGGYRKISRCDDCQCEYYQNSPPRHLHTAGEPTIADPKKKTGF